MISSFAKDPPFRSRRYLAFIRSRTCAWCGKRAPSEASHHPRPGGGSMGAKTCDLRTIPLCSSCHHAYHATMTLGEMNREQTEQWTEVQINQCLSAYLREKHFRGGANA